MKKIMKITSSISSMLAFALITASNAFASGCGGVNTAIIKCGAGSEEGAAIFSLLNIAVNVATFGVGTAAIIGIGISAYQYIMARDNAAAVGKAKNRILQIVIGLAVWVLFWGVLQFLLPGGFFATGD